MPILPTNNDMCFFRLAHQKGHKTFPLQLVISGVCLCFRSGPTPYPSRGRLPFPSTGIPDGTHRRILCACLWASSCTMPSPLMSEGFSPQLPQFSVIFPQFSAMFRIFFVICVFFLQEMITTYFNWTLTRFFWRPVCSLNYKNNVFSPFLGGKRCDRWF